MGNALHRHGRVKMMKLDGEVVKVKAPVTVGEIVKDYPGHVILHSDAVRHLGVKAKPLDGSANLKTKHLYFLVELPQAMDPRCAPRRVRSGITMNAESRLESMLLMRRSISDISVMNSSSKGEDTEARRVKIRLSKAELAKMMAESEDGAETAQKIMESYLNQEQNLRKVEKEEDEKPDNLPGSTPESSKKMKESRVRFVAPQHGEVY